MEQIRSSSDCSVRPDEAIILLRSMPLMHGLAEDYLKKIAEALQPVQFGPGEPIVRLNCGGAGLYIIWDGEAKVISPPVPSGSLGHTESSLRRGDFFGIKGPLMLKYRYDVVAIKQVLCLVLPNKNVDLLVATSVWDWDSRYEKASKIEHMLTLQSVPSVGDLKMESPSFPNYYAPYMNGTNRPFPKILRTQNWFGGQLVAQALLAAAKSVDPEQLVHSLHSYFVKAANMQYNVVFNVEKIRNGRSYATRHVRATQHGNICFVLYASFKRGERSDFDHTLPMPRVPGPEECVSIEQRWEDFIWDARLPLSDKNNLAGHSYPLAPIEMRYVDPDDKFRMLKSEPRQGIWMRSRGAISSQDQNFHRCIAAYASDLAILDTSKLPHPVAFTTQTQSLSLDHSMWFHRSFDAHEWLLFATESPTSGDGRGFVLGRFYTQDGKLVISVVQEGIFRLQGQTKPNQTVAKL